FFGSSPGSPLLAATALAIAVAALLTQPSCGAARRSEYFQISVLDDATGRGVPMVELAALNAVRYHTDSNGVIAFLEPHLMGEEVYFEVRSHGYQPPKLPDGKTEGVVLIPVRGGRAAI